MALGRLEEADTQITRGLAKARELGLTYEEGLLLETRASLLRAMGREADAGESRRCKEIMTALGVR